MFKGKSKSKYAVSAGRGGGTLRDVELWGTFSFLFRSQDMNKVPVSRWGHDGKGNQFCILHFDVEINEGGKCNMFKSATVALDFNRNNQKIQIHDITPDREQIQRLDGRITQEFSLEPNLNIGVAGGAIGGFRRTADVPGPVHWRFFGTRGNGRVDWTWICEKSYSTAQGTPSMVVGVVIPLHNHDRFKGGVSMRVSPRHFWQKINNPTATFPMEFISLPMQNEDDISDHIKNFQDSFVR